MALIKGLRIEFLTRILLIIDSVHACSELAVGCLELQLCASRASSNRMRALSVAVADN
jgi:hypothetical protein